MTPVDYPVVLCPAEDRDYGFIVAHWIETSRPHYVPVSIWKRIIRECILADLQHGRGTVAHSPEDRDHLYGFAVSRDGVLRYVYVRPSRRKAGLGASLVSGLGGYAPGPRHGEMWARRRGMKARNG